MEIYNFCRRNIKILIYKMFKYKKLRYINLMLIRLKVFLVFISKSTNASIISVKIKKKLLK